ncbi:ABC transporter ATP-binding protein [Paracoccus sulfuroxidans]|uniref:Branched-chain amino acid transport system ATP-binding protein n=1 Tax=Paracoccus sulfuroxidans TaxID=384678 RepID=A0A562NGG0_9RHOB|nr:ABC transporter ATP-binding protein [Paracoccus sulfuroxidans]TWI31227.1 branched-chain amino acid transport system ATP-binding protein [Paracoccus sulfuroxidans]
MTDDRLVIEALTSGYGETDILQGATLTLRRGEILALMGRNGMGKTTLLKTVMGLIPTRGGRVSLDGVPINGKPPAWLLAQGVGYAPQELPLFQDLSIRDNLRLALRGDRDLATALKIVERNFPFLLERLDQLAGTLSGGEQKMLILSRALMTEPDILLIDEISEGIQPSVVQRIETALKAEREQRGVSILVVEQNLGFALGVADRWAVMKLGQIVDEGACDAASRETVLKHLSI